MAKKNDTSVNDIPDLPGARFDAASGDCAFCVWAPLKEKIELVLAGDPETIAPMTRNERGYWRTTSKVKPGARYFYRIDEVLDRPDPASFFQPDGVHAPSEVIAAISPGLPPTGRRPEDMIISEIHVGTFTAEGTFRAAVESLGRLTDAGINTVEIMPVAQFPGRRNWGYDGAYPFAVQNSYGGPQGLSFFVDGCHRRGVSVILDVVYNHLGPEGNYIGDFGPYFTDKYRTPWGNAINFDGEHSKGARNFFISNALYWFERFGVDALRLDAIHGIFDAGPAHILAELAQKIDELSAASGRKFYLIAESDLNDSAVVRPASEGGYGIDAQWSDDYHHALHTLLTGEKDGYYADFGSVEDFVKAYGKGVVFDGCHSVYRRKKHGNSYDGVPASRFVVCAQNHDQIGNRMLGERLSNLVDFESLKLAAACVMLSPFVPLFFMGDEYAEDAPFLYFVDHGDVKLLEAVKKGRESEFAAFAWKTAPPDPSALSTFEISRLRPETADSPRGRAMGAYFRALADIRKTRPELKSDFSTLACAASTGRLVTVRRKNAAGETMIFFNFSENPSIFDRINPSRLVKIIDSSDEKWIGPGEPERAENGVSINPRSAAVYEIKND
jgi:maltooligosyltrehalose trehalohydrolase